MHRVEHEEEAVVLVAVVDARGRGEVGEQAAGRAVRRSGRRCQVQPAETVVAGGEHQLAQVDALANLHEFVDQPGHGIGRFEQRPAVVELKDGLAAHLRHHRHPGLGEEHAAGHGVGDGPFALEMGGQQPAAEQLRIGGQRPGFEAPQAGEHRQAERLHRGRVRHRAEEVAADAKGCFVVPGQGGRVVCGALGHHRAADRLEGLAHPQAGVGKGQVPGGGHPLHRGRQGPLPAEQAGRLAEVVAVADGQRNPDHRPVDHGRAAAAEQGRQFAVQLRPLAALAVVGEHPLPAREHGVEVAAIVRGEQVFQVFGQLRGRGRG